MLNINNFLIKFKKITITDDNIKEYISKIIFTISNIKIEKSNIKINNKLIYIKTTNITKTEIFLNKEDILNKINNKFPKIKLRNII